MTPSEAIEQSGLPDRLEEAGRDAGGFHGGLIEAFPQRGQHDHFDTCQLRVAFDRMGQRQTVHSRHPHVEDDELKWVAGLDCGSQGGKGGGSVGRGFGFQAPVSELMTQDFTVGGIVVHDQGPRRAEAPGLIGRGG